MKKRNVLCMEDWRKKRSEFFKTIKDFDAAADLLHRDGDYSCQRINGIVDAKDENSIKMRDICIEVFFKDNWIATIDSKKDAFLTQKQIEESNPRKKNDEIGFNVYVETVADVSIGERVEVFGDIHIQNDAGEYKVTIRKADSVTVVCMEMPVEKPCCNCRFGGKNYTTEPSECSLCGYQACRNEPDEVVFSRLRREYLQRKEF